MTTPDKREPLKVYGGCYEGRQRLIVAAKSGAAARRYTEAVGLRITAYEWSRFYGETGNEIELALVREYGDVFTADNRRARTANSYTKVEKP